MRPVKFSRGQTVWTALSEAVWIIFKKCCFDVDSMDLVKLIKYKIYMFVQQREQKVSFLPVWVDSEIFELIHA